MSLLVRFVGILCLTVGASACGSEAAQGDDDAATSTPADATTVQIPPSPPGPVVSTGYPCPVAEVLARVCRRCHSRTTPNSAPFPLDQWADTQAPYGARPVYEEMEDMLLSKKMPLAPVTITEADRTTLLTWLDGGALKGIEADDHVCQP